MNAIDKYFKISERNNSIKTEIVAGLSTFAAMSYILAVNPAILSTTGMGKAGLITVTALMAFISTFAMGIFTNRPIALAPAMGTNAYFAFFVCAAMNIPWNQALSLVFYNGIFFVLISIFKIREKIIDAIPSCLQIGLQCGIGLFIAYMGLNHANIIVPNKETLTQLGDIATNKSLLAFLGFLIIAILSMRKYSFAVILSIILITIASFFVKDVSGNAIAQAPSKIFSMPASISETFFAVDFLYPFRDIQKTLPIILTLLILDFFDSIGTIVALAHRANFLKNGKVPEMTKILLVDSSATVLGALLGTSTVSCYVESATGIESGAKTGFSAVVTSICFLLALFITPLIFAIPQIATAPALIWVGIMMMTGLANIDFKKLSDFLPAIVCAITIMLSFSITKGFAFGIILYSLLKITSKEYKQVTIPTWILTIVMLIFIAGA